MLFFLKKENIEFNCKYKNKLLKAIDNIKKNYISIKELNNINLNILNFETQNYTEDIFLFPEKVKEEFDKNKIINIKNIKSIIEFKNILEKLKFFNKTSINHLHYKNILEIDNISIYNNLANIETLRFISNKLLIKNS
jgi:hypothetical protein